MTDPLKLAEEIEDRLRREGGQYWPTFGPAEVRLIAAAIRLAEARIRYSSLRSRAAVSDIEDHRRREVETDDAMIAANRAEKAYRAAREGR